MYWENPFNQLHIFSHFFIDLPPSCIAVKVRLLGCWNAFLPISLSLTSLCWGSKPKTKRTDQPRQWTAERAVHLACLIRVLKTCIPVPEDSTLRSLPRAISSKWLVSGQRLKTGVLKWTYFYLFFVGTQRHRHQQSQSPRCQCSHHSLQHHCSFFPSFLP